MNITNSETDANWFSYNLGKILIEKLHDKSIGLNNIVNEAVGILNIKYSKFCQNLNYEVDITPSASLSIFRIKDNIIEHFQLGDCISIIQYYNDKIDIMHDKSVPILDKMVIDHIIEQNKNTEVSFREAINQDKKMLIENRLKRNKRDGYWILDLSGIGIAHAQTAVFSLQSIKRLAIFSDGFAEIVELFKLYSYNSLVEAMSITELDLLCNQLFKAQENDFMMNKFPRLKHRDDCSAVFCEL